MESVAKAKLLLILRWSSSLRPGRQNISLAYVVGACVGYAFFAKGIKPFPICLYPKQGHCNEHPLGRTMVCYLSANALTRFTIVALSCQ